MSPRDVRDRFQVRLEVVDGYTMVTVYDCAGLAIGDWDQVATARLDDVLRLPNALSDIAALAYESDDVNDLLELYKEIATATERGEWL